MTGINSDIIGQTTMDIVLKEFLKLSNKEVIFSENEVKQVSDLETVLMYRNLNPKGVVFIVYYSSSLSIRYPLIGS